MSEFFGSSKPISIRTMKDCCLATIEAYVRGGGAEAEGMVVKCSRYPKSSDHRIALKDGKWQGKVRPAVSPAITKRDTDA